MRKCSVEYQTLAKYKERLAKQGKKSSKKYNDTVEKIKAIEKAEHKKFHALRHTHATELLSNGVNIMDVTRRLGHSKASTTLDFYGHAIPDNDKKIATKVSKLYKY